MKTLKWIIIFILVISFTSWGFTEEIKRTAEVSKVRGKVEIRPEGLDIWIPAKRGTVLNEGDILRTKEKSWTVLDLTGVKGEKATMRVEENSQLMLSELIKDETREAHKSLLDLAIGKVLIKAKEMKSEESKFEIKTPTSVVGIRGTEFTVEVEALE